MKIAPEVLADQYARAVALWSFIHDLESDFGLPRFLLFAVGSRETNLNPKFTEGATGDGGHGHGVFQLDDRWHVIPDGFDTDIHAQAHKAAEMLASLYQRHESWLGACNAYNSGSPLTERTTGKDYGPDVLERREFLASLKGMTSVQIIRAAMADPIMRDVPVEYVSGWETRGRPYTFTPRGCVIHHTATNRHAAGEYPSLGIVRDGRSDLPGPLAQFGLGRTGTVIVIASGTSNHAGPGGWKGLSGNTSVWGVEAENDGIGQPWHPDQLENYPRLVAALAKHTSFSAEMVCCHREWNPVDKIDPTGIDGPAFRARVAELLSGSVNPKENLPMEFTYIVNDEDWVWLGAERIHARCASGDVLEGLKAGGQIVGLGRKSAEFHNWLHAVAENSHFSR